MADVEVQERKTTLPVALDADIDESWITSSHEIQVTGEAKAINSERKDVPAELLIYPQVEDREGQIGSARIGHTFNEQPKAYQTSPRLNSETVAKLLQLPTIGDQAIPSSPKAAECAVASAADNIVHRLPAEIWRAIFRLLPKDLHTVICPSRGPFVLSHVCQYLRNIVLGMQDVWDTLGVPLFKFSTSNALASFRDQFPVILNLSGNRPLTFSIDVKSYLDQKNKHLAYYCLRLLFTHARRWKVVYFNSIVLDHLTTYIRPGGLPCLEHLGVIGYSPCSIIRSHPAEELLETAPMLTSVECLDFAHRDEGIPHPMLLCLPHVTHCSMGASLEPKEWADHVLDLRVLHLDNLTSLDLYFPASGSSQLRAVDHMEMTIELNTLTRLSLTFWTPDWIHYICAVYSFPKLTSLTIKTGLGLEPSWDGERASIITLLSGCAATLSDLGLSFHLLQDPSLHNEVQTLSSVEFFTIYDIRWNAKFFDWFGSTFFRSTCETDLSTFPDVFPCLRGLSLQNYPQSPSIDRRWSAIRTTGRRYGSAGFWDEEDRLPIQTEEASSRTLELDRDLFDAPSVFIAGMLLFREFVASRGRRSKAVSLDKHILETFRLSYDCLFAMREYAPDVWTFLTKRWETGLGGQPSASEVWEWDLPEGWAGRVPVPRFFREVDEDPYEDDEDSEQFNTWGEEESDGRGEMVFEIASYAADESGQVHGASLGDEISDPSIK